MNAVIVYLIQQVVFVLHNLYAIQINKVNRNCYNCGALDIWQDIVGIREYKTESLWLSDLICVQNTVVSLVLYNGLNSIKSLWLFHFIWVKICDHIYLCPFFNYLLLTLQIYLDFIQSFSLSKSELLYNVSLMKHLLRDLF